MGSRGFSPLSKYIEEVRTMKLDDTAGNASNINEGGESMNMGNTGINDAAMAEAAKAAMAETSTPNNESAEDEKRGIYVPITSEAHALYREFQGFIPMEMRAKLFESIAGLPRSGMTSQPGRDPQPAVDYATFRPDFESFLVENQMGPRGMVGIDSDAAVTCEAQVVCKGRKFHPLVIHNTEKGYTAGNYLRQGDSVIAVCPACRKELIEANKERSEKESMPFRMLYFKPHDVATAPIRQKRDRAKELLDGATTNVGARMRQGGRDNDNRGGNRNSGGYNPKPHRH